MSAVIVLWWRNLFSSQIKNDLHDIMGNKILKYILWCSLPLTEGTNESQTSHFQTRVALNVCICSTAGWRAFLRASGDGMPLETRAHIVKSTLSEP